MGVKVSDTDRVFVDDRPLKETKTYTLLMNKPIGYVTTMKDPHGRRTVIELLPDMGATLRPVGRLDMDSEGLLLFTNDGELANRLTHPRYGLEKEYEVIVEGSPAEASLDKLRKGIWIVEGGKTAPAKVEKVQTPERTTSVLRITIHEGRKRQVRLMFEAIGHPVRSLKRVRIGPLKLHQLPRGGCRMLGKMEVDKLKKIVGLD